VTKPCATLLLASPAALALGLWIDVRVDLPGQSAVGAALWLLLLSWLATLPRAERRPYFACIVLATAGELFLSQVWGLYAYRLGNVPLFVPPGHGLLLMLALWLAPRTGAAAAKAVFWGAAAYAAAAGLSGLDQMAAPMFLLMAIAWLALPAQRRLFAATFVLALALELYGTRVGCWAWARSVPWTGLASTNPPLCAGGIYCALDALVIAACAALAPQAAKTCARSQAPASAIGIPVARSAEARSARPETTPTACSSAVAATKPAA
jgi:hypothetical protein